MDPLGVIEGAVTDGEGAPLRGVAIEAITISFEGGRRSRATERTATTDDRGAYRLWNLRPGEYYVRVAGKTGATVSVSRDVVSEWRYAIPPVYHGGSTTLQAATPIRISAGQQVRADFLAHAQPAHAVRGTVVGYAPGAPPGFELILPGSERITGRAAFDSASGRFALFDVAPGVYRLRIKEADGASPKQGEAEITVGNSDLADVAIQLVAVEVKWVVHDPADESGRCTVEGELSNSESSGQEEHYSRAPSDGEGGPQLLPGLYDLRLAASGCYPSAVALDGKPQHPEEKPLQAGDQAHVLEVWMSADGGNIRGTLETPDVPAIAYLILAPQGPSFSSPQLFNANRGRFEYSGLAPGQYVVLAFRAEPNVEYSNPTVQEQFRGGTRIEIRANETTQVAIRSINE